MGLSVTALPFYLGHMDEVHKFVLGIFTKKKLSAQTQVDPFNGVPKELVLTSDPDLVAIYYMTLGNDTTFDELIELFGEDKIREYKDLLWGSKDRGNYLFTSGSVVMPYGSISHSATLEAASEAQKTLAQIREEFGFRRNLKHNMDYIEAMESQGKLNPEALCVIDPYYSPQLAPNRLIK
jgi:hypothetical protein